MEPPSPSSSPKSRRHHLVDTGVGVAPPTSQFGEHAVEIGAYGRRRSPYFDTSGTAPTGRRQWISVTVDRGYDSDDNTRGPEAAENLHRSSSNLDLKLLLEEQQQAASAHPSGRQAKSRKKSKYSRENEDRQVHAEGSRGKTDWKAESKRVRELPGQLRAVIIVPEKKSTLSSGWSALTGIFSAEDPIINPDQAFPALLDALLKKDYDTFLSQSFKSVVAGVDEAHIFLRDYMQRKEEGATTANVDFSKAQQLHKVLNTPEFQNLRQAIKVLSRYSDSSDPERSAKFAQCYSRISDIITVISQEAEQAMKFAQKHSHIKVPKFDEASDLLPINTGVLKRFEAWVPEYLKAWNSKYGDRIRNAQFRLAREAQYSDPMLHHH